MHVIAPIGKGKTIGSGVHQTQDGIDFSVTKLEEINAFYGKPFFNGFYQALKLQKPDLLVIGWPYFLAFVFNPMLYFKIKRLGIKIIGREIPLAVPFANETFEDFNKRNVEWLKDEKMFHSRKRFEMIKWMRKVFYGKRADGALLYTEAGRPVISSYGLSNDQIFVHYNSPDEEPLFNAIDKVKQHQPDLVQKPHRLIHLGRLVYWKRVELILTAVSKLKNEYPDIELVVVGDGPELDNLKQQAKALDIEKHIVFAGSIYEPEKIAEQLLQAGVYVLAGMGGLSINEAMCHSLPVICSVCDGTEKELVFEGENGYYFEVDKVDSLVVVIKKMFDHPDASKKMGEKSLDIIKHKVNIDLVCNKYLEAFNHFIK